VEEERSAQLSAEKTKHFAFQSFGAQFCEVKVDEQLGRVRVTRWVSAFDPGRVLNPKTARSQVLGGIIMGIGAALMEHTVYDRRTARPVTDNLADHAVPVHADAPQIDALFIDRPDPHINTLGCRGVGELSITGVAAAVANAVHHATGKRIRALPITPDKLLPGQVSHRLVTARSGRRG
jgi:xanthine dehydrogenase YagR molybdenum-binding subunit